MSRTETEDLEPWLEETARRVAAVIPEGELAAAHARGPRALGHACRLAATEAVRGMPTSALPNAASREPESMRRARALGALGRRVIEIVVERIGRPPQPALPTRPPGWEFHPMEQEEWVKDPELPRVFPRSARRLFALEVSRGPGMTDTMAYSITSNRRRTRWVLWEGNDAMSLYGDLDWQARGWAPRKGVNELTAAVYLVLDCWLWEQELWQFNLRDWDLVSTALLDTDTVDALENAVVPSDGDEGYGATLEEVEEMIYGG